MTKFPQREAIDEASTFDYSTILVQPDGITPVEDEQVDEIRLHWRDATPEAPVDPAPSGWPVINNRDGSTNMKASLLGAGGVITWVMAPEDTIAIGAAPLQPRILTLDIRLAGGGRRTHAALMWVRNHSAIT